MGLQAELAHMRRHLAHARVSTKRKHSRHIPTAIGCRVLVYEVPAASHLQLVHFECEVEQGISLDFHAMHFARIQVPIIQTLVVAAE
jgi:hypothetical protein